MTVLELIEAGSKDLADAGLAFGHGTVNAFDEAAWLVLWQLGLPIDDLEGAAEMAVSLQQQRDARELIAERIRSRKPAAYLTREAWLQGVPFYVDERAIVPRSFIAELLVDGSLDPWLVQSPQLALDLCTGNGSLAIIAAMTYPNLVVDAADISEPALDVARVNRDKHRLGSRIRLVRSDGLRMVHGLYDLILCNPPYVNAQSMAQLPPEYRAEPELALAGGSDGMTFIRTLLPEAADHMNEHAVLVLEIGNERANFEAAFGPLEVVWLETSAGQDQVLLVTRESLLQTMKQSS